MLEVCLQGYRCILSIEPRYQILKHREPKKDAFSHHQHILSLPASTVKPQSSFHTEDEEIEELIKPHDTKYLEQISSNIHRLGCATRSKAPQSDMEHRRMWDYRHVVPDPPSTSHTLNKHIFLIKPQIHLLLLSLPTQLPSNVTLLPGNTSSLEDKKCFIVFLPFTAAV